MPKSSKSSPKKPAKRAVKDLAPAKAARVKGGGKINSGGVNPIVISRDRSMGNG